MRNKKLFVLIGILVFLVIILFFSIQKNFINNLFQPSETTFIGDPIQESIEKNGWASVIIGLNYSPEFQLMEPNDPRKIAEMDRLQEELLADLIEEDIKNVKRIEGTSYFTASVSSTGLEKLERDIRVSSINYNMSLDIY